MVFPPGYRFFPTEEELISFYLHHKLDGGSEELNQVINKIIPVRDIYEHDPWDLPQISGDLNPIKDPEQWFFFIPRQESEARGGRPKRLTNTGYWKATGSPGSVFSNNRSIGLKRTMVFYSGRAPNGRKTEWKMNEYKAIDQGEASSSTRANPKLRHEYSLCRVYKSSKCLRSFDRRPVGLEVAEPRAQPASGGNELAAAPDQNLPIVDNTGSPESSCSGDLGDPSRTGESSSMPMSIDNDAWDVDLDWYYSAGQD